MIGPETKMGGGRVKNLPGVRLKERVVAESGREARKIQNRAGNGSTRDVLEAPEHVEKVRRNSANGEFPLHPKEGAAAHTVETGPPTAGRDERAGLSRNSPKAICPAKILAVAWPLGC